MISFKQIKTDSDIDDCVTIIRTAFRTVADEFGITRENVPSNPAFITSDNLKGQITKDRSFYILFNQDSAAGTIAIEKSPNEKDLYIIEKVAILSEYRHQGLGKKLMNFAENQIKALGGNIVSVAIIYENLRLRSWYEQQGYVEHGRKKFDHLPFTVSFLQKHLG